MIKVCWSGGKDSTFLVRLYREQYGSKGYFISNYIPMLTDDIPLLTREHYEHIQRMIDKYASEGIEIYSGSGMTYYDYCMRYAFPAVDTKYCRFRNNSKLEVLKDNHGHNVIFTDIGIAADETKRHHILKNSLCSTLVKRNITELDCYYFDRLNKELSPLYNIAWKDGCIICPNETSIIREKYFNDYPEAIPIIKEIQNSQNKDGFYPLRGSKNLYKDSSDTRALRVGCRL